MTKKSRSRIVKDTTKNKIATVVPDANRIMQELAMAFPERPTDTLVSWVEGLERSEREALVQRMIHRIAHGIESGDVLIAPGVPQ